MTNIDQQKNALWNEQGDNVHFKMPNQYKVLMVFSPSLGQANVVLDHWKSQKLA